MTDCKSFSSLFALVDSHLSNLNLQETTSNENVTSSIPIPNVSKGHSSENRLSSTSQTVPMAKCASESPISQILATQVNNMLLAKEKRLQEDRKIKQAKEEIKPKEDDIIIDLMQALQPSPRIMPQIKADEISISSSCESLFDIQPMDYHEEVTPIKTEPLLPCIKDMSYILNMKIKQNKCSNFGKVLTSRKKPVLGLYWHDKFDTKVKSFKFDTPSPCDVIKSKLRKPTMSCTYTVSITDDL